MVFQGSFEYVATLPTLVSCLCTLVFGLVVSPLVSSQAVPVYNSLDRLKKQFWNTLPGSTVHAIIATSLALIAIFGGYIDNYVKSKSELGFLIVQLSLGYFIGDLILVLSSEQMRKDKGTVAHHLASMAGVFLSAYFQGQFIFFPVYRLITELSTPFVNMRWFLNEAGVPKTSNWYIFSAVGMTVTFFVSRILPIPWHWWVTITAVMDEAASEVPIFYRGCLIALYIVFDLLNVYWMYKMARGALKYRKLLQKNS